MYYDDNEYYMKNGVWFKRFNKALHRKHDAPAKAAGIRLGRSLGYEMVEYSLITGNDHDVDLLGTNPITENKFFLECGHKPKWHGKQWPKHYHYGITWELRKEKYKDREYPTFFAAFNHDFGWTYVCKETELTEDRLDEHTTQYNRNRPEGFFGVPLECAQLLKVPKNEKQVQQYLKELDGRVIPFFPNEEI